MSIRGAAREKVAWTMNRQPKITLRPLSAALGVEVLGVDLRASLGRATAEVLSAALDEHTILLFRDQDLSESDQLRLAYAFGGPSLRSRPVHKRAEDNPYAEKIGLVTNIRTNITSLVSRKVRASSEWACLHRSNQQYPSFP